MPAPIAFASLSHSVFCYTNDLQDASTKLKTFLGANANYIRILVDRRGSIQRVDGSIEGLYDAAWLVGHGSAANTQISTRGGGVYIDIASILDWCVGNGYTRVIDTCCEPGQRRVEAQTYRGLDYYSAPDSHEVSQIVTYLSLDAWWDANSMSHKPPVHVDDDDL